MSDDRQPLRRYLKRRLGGAGWLRSQTFLVLAASFLVGALASHVLLRLGITDLRLRLPLIVLIAYAVFLALVGVWLRLTGIDAVKVRLDPGRPGEGTERIRDTQASAQGNLLDKAETVADGVSGIGELASIDAEGCLPAVGFAIVAAVIALAALVFWWIIGGFLGAASAALLEAAVEAVLVAAGHRGRRTHPRPDGLTPREIEVLRLVATGASNREIAAKLVISEKTARNHVERTYAKIGVSNRIGASMYALQNGLAAQ